MKNIVNRRYIKLVAVLIAAWFAVAVSASALLAFKSDSNSLSLTLLVAALSPIILFLSWFVTSPAFRQFALSLDTRTLTIALASYDILPELFALPAGWGDITIGITAPLVAIYLAKPAHRRSFIAWHVIGMLDLVTAVTTGVIAGRLGYGPGTRAMTVLPLSLIPTFAVPLLTILHIICIVQAIRWEQSYDASFERGKSGQPLPVGR
jgi:hypothetical protein